MADLTGWEVIVRLLIAAGLGALIGAEREIDGQDAGLRTHLMVALGAALFSVVSVGAFDSFYGPRADSNFQVDPGRIASYVAAGIGFVAGGVILRHAGSVKGLTTAASLWVAAAAGLAAGVGMWLAALVATAAAVLSLVLLRPVRRSLARAAARGARLAVIVLRHDADVAAVVKQLLAQAVTPERFEIGRGESDAVEIAVEYPPSDHELLVAVLATIAGRDDVTAVRTGRAVTR